MGAIFKGREKQEEVRGIEKEGGGFAWTLSSRRRGSLFEKWPNSAGVYWSDIGIFVKFNFGQTQED